MSKPAARRAAIAYAAAAPDLLERALGELDARDAEVERPSSPPRWTTSPPTSPGFYWWQMGPDWDPRTTEVRRDASGLYTDDTGPRVPVRSEGRQRWAGPIPPPTEPVDAEPTKRPLCRGCKMARPLPGVPCCRCGAQPVDAEGEGR